MPNPIFDNCHQALINLKKKLNDYNLKDYLNAINKLEENLNLSSITSESIKALSRNIDNLVKKIDDDRQKQTQPVKRDMKGVQFFAQYNYDLIRINARKHEIVHDLLNIKKLLTNSVAKPTLKP